MPSLKRKLRAPTTSSAISFSDLDQGSVQSLIEHPRSATANYDTALDAAIQDGLARRVICTRAGARPPMIEMLRLAPSVRPVQFHPAVVKKRAHRFNFERVGNAAAFYVQRSGFDVVESCYRCTHEQGMFQGCVVTDNFSHGACANCVYGGNNSKQCTFRKDTSHPDGYKAAQRISRRAALAKKAKFRLPAGLSDVPARAFTPPLTPQSPQHGSDEGFVSSPANAASPKTSVGVFIPVMSGGLGPKDPTAHGPDTDTPKADTTALGKLRKGKKARTASSQPPTRRPRSPSVEFISSCITPKSSKKRKRSGQTAESAEDELSTWLAEERKRTKTVETTTVYCNDPRFAAGEMTPAQFWFIVDICEEENPQFLQNQYLWHKGEHNATHPKDDQYDWTFYEHFLWEDCVWLHNWVISIVCPLRPLEL